MSLCLIVKKLSLNQRGAVENAFFRINLEHKIYQACLLHSLIYLGLCFVDWAAFVTREVYQYLTIFWGIEFIGWKYVASHLFKTLFLQWMCCLKNTSPAHCKLKIFRSACFWSSTLYTVLFDHTCCRLPRHQSTVWDRTQYPTVLLARYLPVWLKVICFYFIF